MYYLPTYYCSINICNYTSLYRRKLSSQLGTRLFRSFEFGNGSRISDEKRLILQFKYLQNKKWQKQVIKKYQNKEEIQNILTVFISLRQLKKLAIYLQKVVIFNIYHVFAPFMKLRRSRFLYFFTLCDVRNEAVFLILEDFSLRRVTQKKKRKNMKFCTLNTY